MAAKKSIQYYLNLNWSYTVEQETHKSKRYYIIRVNELPGVCTDAETLEEGMLQIKDAISGAIRLYLKNNEPLPEAVEEKADLDDARKALADVKKKGSVSWSEIKRKLHLRPTK